MQAAGCKASSSSSRAAGAHVLASRPCSRAAARHVAAAGTGGGSGGGGTQREVAVLGGEDFIYSQRSGVEEDLFKGSVLGVDADVAGGGSEAAGAGFHQTHLRSLAHLPDGLEAPPRFLERVAVHYARNALAGLGALPGQVPLVLGIWGPKGGSGAGCGGAKGRCSCGCGGRLRTRP